MVSLTTCSSTRFKIRDYGYGGGYGGRGGRDRDRDGDDRGYGRDRDYGRERYVVTSWSCQAATFVDQLPRCFVCEL